MDLVAEKHHVVVSTGIPGPAFRGSSNLRLNVEQTIAFVKSHEVAVNQSPWPFHGRHVAQNGFRIGFDLI